MSNTERAVNSVAVMKFHWLAKVLAVLVVAAQAEVVSSEAAEQGNGAAVLALPIDLHVTMLLTGCLSDS